MTSKKKISIVVPVYNGEKYIEQTLRKILNSTYKNLEILVINDGSSDSSEQICEKMQKEDKRILIFSKENGGVVSARNYGVLKATGEFLCFCDQDDSVEKETYARQIEKIEEDKSDICICSTGRSVEDKLSIFEISEDACYEDEDILKNLLYPMLFNGFDVPIEMSRINRYSHIWSCMFRIDFWKKYMFQFRAYINFEDDLLLKIDVLTKAKRVSTLAYVGYYWNINLQSETYAHKYVENIAEKQQKCYEDMLQCISERVSDSGILEIFTQITFCKHYLDAIHNISSPYVKKNRLYIKKYYQENIYNRDFYKNIQAKKYLKKGHIKPAILLPLIEKKWTTISYIMENLLEQALFVMLHSHFLTKLERRLKGYH